MGRKLVWLLLLALEAWSLARASASRPVTRAEGDFFEKNIRPVLEQRCYECHSEKASRLKGGLALDTREGVQKGGDLGPVLVPGDPAKSRLIAALRHQSEDLQMPPDVMLPPDQIAHFEEWVRMGAPDPRAERAGLAKGPMTLEEARNFWAFKPLSRPQAPRVKNRRWPQTPVDHFILADLEERKLKPASPASKRALLRRATFDLLGLPPTPAELDAFARDESPDAFARVVDRLLASSSFGERWGRHWLDVARYADSNGLENNLPFQNAWRYRDYVIGAFNADKPYSEFIREQLAGDLLPSSSETERLEQLVATGFLSLGPKMLFEPNQEKLLMDVADEQIDVTTKAFLGLTVSCARCHDHKFDPIPTRDYYALAGIFKSTRTLSRTRAMQEIPDSPRWVERSLASPEETRKREAYDMELNRLQDAFAQARQERMDAPGEIMSGKLPGIVVDNLAAEVTGMWKESFYSTNFVDKNYLQDGNADKGRKSVRFTPDLPKAGRYEVLVAYVARPDRAKNVPVTVHAADGLRKIALDQSKPAPIGKVFASVGTYEFKAGTNGAVTISNEGTRGFVVADAVQFVPAPEESMMSMMAAQPVRALRGAVPKEMDGKPLSPDMEALALQINEFRKTPPPLLPRAMAVDEGEPVNCKINIRGDPEKLGEESPRGFLTVLSPNGKPAQVKNLEGSGRLELAGWIASAENPLTARVAVNRIWRHLFGRGLVESVDNFGAMGDKPGNPELLDYLARYFAENGWSTKKTIRMLMLSSVYQMSSEPNSAALAKDPDNKLFWRANLRRLDAEAIRDSMLAVSGQLDLKAGGANEDAPPEARPVGDAIQAAGNRRSVYLPVIRNNLTDMFQVFDFAEPHVTSGKRFSTTAATQALFMMNSPFLMEQARHWAEALLKTPGKDSGRIAQAYLQAYGRLPSPEETERAARFLQRFEAGAAAASGAEKRRLAWQSFCHALFASTEFTFLN